MGTQARQAEAVRRLLDDPACTRLLVRDAEADGAATLVTGAPGAGKTTLAIGAAQRGMDAFGADAVVLAVPNRTLADDYAPALIRHAGVSTQARPATTLNALAFRLVTAQRAREGAPLPKLLNGAEQDALLRRVLAVHLAHVRAGDDCATCRLLRDYFANERWMRYVADDWQDAPQDGEAPSTSEGLLEEGISPAFTAQLRDMLARMDEAGATGERETAVLDAVADAGLSGERLRIQWRLAFALRREYIASIARAYPGEYRLDSSYLQVAGAQAARGLEATDLPRLVVVDDFQDATLAGLAFLEALQARGTRLLLVGNPDESVQSFRGSHPDYLFAHARTAMHALAARLDAAEHADPTFLDTLAARVSLSIASTEDTDTPLAARPGKLPALPGAWPVRVLGEDDPRRKDGTVAGLLYRSSSEELENVLWQVKTAHLQQGLRWNDMAVVMHDNDAIRRTGERLRDSGVPVRYSSVTRPLAQEPFVQALFALIELARLRNDGLEHRSMDLATAAAFVRSRVTMIVRSPLLARSRGNELPQPLNMEPVDAALRALQALAAVVEDDRDGEEDGHGLRGLTASWEQLRERVRQAHAARREASGVEILGADGDDLDFGIDALYLMLAQDGSQAVLDAVAGICGTDRERSSRRGEPAQRFRHLWETVDDLAGRLRRLDSDAPQFALEAAWISCDVARRWQRDALFNTPAGRAANDRLDTAMRLFEYASGDGVAPTIGAFIGQVRQLQVEADSLARLAPVDDAVTLATPAGAVGHRFRQVWMPGVQEGTWPNLAARNTMFGGEDLVDILLTGMLDEQRDAAAGHGDPAMQRLLATEQKSFLVALTRATDRVVVSAALNDDAAPSDFLYAYLPEHFDRARDADPLTRTYATLGMRDGDDRGGEGDGTDRQGLDADARGLIALARIALAEHEPGSAEARDAVDTLAMLARAGFEDADPRTWPFLEPAPVGASGGEDGRRPASAADAPVATARHGAHAHHGPAGEGPARADGRPHYADPYGPPTVTLSPSQVDRLWGCPVCARMEQQFAGPQRASVATDYGSIIHDVAQAATEEGWDRADFLADLDRDARVAQVTDLMTERYLAMRPDPDGLEDAEERYRALDRDAETAEILGRIASYFVDSNLPGRYDVGSTGEYEIGTLADAQAEVAFTARFDLADITAAYNAIDGIRPVDVQDMMGIMGALVGGWPDTMSPDLSVRLTGRMDRLEQRTLADGSATVRIIDYKTTGGTYTGAEYFNDLQLVCYQLALAFPEGTGLRGTAAVEAMPDIAQSDLFQVRASSKPATKSGAAAEPYFQEPLFRDGSVNAHPFTQRANVKSLDKVADFALPAEPPADVDPQAWADFVSLRGTLAPWAIAMIARIFYTAAASRAELLVAHPTQAHLGQCRTADLCPACKGRAATVYETTEG